MAISEHDTSTRNDIELGLAVDWPLVRLAAILGGIVVAGLVGVVVLAAAQTTQPPQPVETAVAIRPAPPPRSAGQIVKPAAIVETAPSSEPAMWKALAPAPAALVPIPTLAPRVVLAVEPVPASEEQQQPSLNAPMKSPRNSESTSVSVVLPHVQEIDINTVEGASAKLSAKSVDDVQKTENVVDLIARRADLAGLPVRAKAECTLSEEDAKPLGDVSKELRLFLTKRSLSKADTDYPSAAVMIARDERIIDELADRKEWLKDQYAPGLAQMLCVESVPIRQQLTKMLAACKGRNASVALARQALFDLDSSVRDSAVSALRNRPSEEYRQTLLDGMRYPWPPIADHAAIALTEIDDRAAAPALAKMLSLPDPTAPALTDKKKWVKAEVVKVNHLRNCLLCHAPSSNKKDPVRGFIPVPGKEIPVAYYVESKGDFVRADVTYLKQDFSAMENVPDPNKWPSMQRFDFMVRRRELTEDEVKAMADVSPQPARIYPQQEAVRFALEKLSAPRPQPSQ